MRKPRLTDRVLRALLDACGRAASDYETSSQDDGEMGREAIRGYDEMMHAQAWVLGMIHHRKQQNQPNPGTRP